MEKSNLRAGIAVLCVAATLLGGCKNKKRELGALSDPAAGGAVAAPVEPVRVAVDNLSFERLALRGRGRVEAPNLGQDFSYRIHIESGQRIWVQVNGPFNIEVARLLATRDQFQLVNRLRQEYLSGTYDLLRERLGIHMNYDLLQDILVGDATRQNPSYRPYYALNGTNAAPTYALTDQRYVLEYFINPDLRKLARLQAVDTTQAPLTRVQYGNFTAVDGQQLPYQVDVEVLPKDTRIQLAHREVQFNPASLSFSFSIPEGYQQIR